MRICTQFHPPGMMRTFTYAIALGYFCALRCIIVRAQPGFSCGYLCPDGTCIPYVNVCDGIPHCADSKDEMENCPCPSDEFRCSSGVCIPADWECNGYDNCGDASDEHHSCPVCGSRRFQCDNGLCINLHWECDGDDDCGDNSDEQGCPECPSNSFQCDNKACIDVSWVCDGENDCGDWSDENEFCPEVSCDEERHFLCDNNRCIYNGFECDGENDCGDMSDESNCLPRTCGGELTALSGTFVTPNYPFLYPNDAKCTWIFKGPVGTVVEVHFNDFKLQDSEYSEERGGNVCYDWIEILEKKWSRLAVGYCGTGAHGITFTSIENYLWLQFRSGNSTADSGFSAQYNIVTHRCQNILCYNGGTCVAHGTSYRCQCLAGYTGQYCETQEINPCQDIFCDNGGTCLISNGNGRCLCQPGYAGEYCQIGINPCQDINCMNGGTCAPDGNSFQCQCPSEYTGQHCETVINPCQGITCFNGGTCYPYGTDGNTFTCQCQEGFSGQYCQTAINPCQDITCMNGGTCAAGGNSFQCQCLAQYTGQLCETVVNPCQDINCLNGGTCYPYGTGGNIFTCQCREGYSGQYCQTASCNTINCKNGGTCRADGISVSCQCQDGYTGHYCETDVSECSSNPCKNGGQCDDLVNRFTCNCLSGFEGLMCETEINRDGCKHPGDIENGFVISESDQSETYAAGQTLELVCRGEYILDGPSQIYCTNEMDWSHPLPKCIAKGENESSALEENLPLIGGAAAGVVVIVILVIVLVVVCMKRRSRTVNETECRTEPTVYFVPERTTKTNNPHDNDRRGNKYNPQQPVKHVNVGYLTPRYEGSLSNRPPFPNPRPNLQTGDEYEVIGGFQNNVSPPDDYVDLMNDRIKLTENK